MSLLGAMILDPRVIGDIIPLMKGPEDFYKEAHQHIYQALVDVYDQFNTGDLVQIVDMLRHRRVLEQVGGSEYLVELANAVPTSVNAPHFARLVAEKAKLRRLIDAAPFAVESWLLPRVENAPLPFAGSFSSNCCRFG